MTDFIEFVTRKIEEDKFAFCSNDILTQPEQDEYKEEIKKFISNFFPFIILDKIFFIYYLDQSSSLYYSVFSLTIPDKKCNQVFQETNKIKDNDYNTISIHSDLEIQFYCSGNDYFFIHQPEERIATKVLTVSNGINNQKAIQAIIFFFCTKIVRDVLHSYDIIEFKNGKIAPGYSAIHDRQRNRESEKIINIHLNQIQEKLKILGDLGLDNFDIKEKLNLQ